ncbi:hypothetical protein Leryth_009835 [Lithospermum erythrorhizon]|nr:hypothetical protein Leryth_009835 [Lithospermum erythrorhizon]
MPSQQPPRKPICQLILLANFGTASNCMDGVEPLLRRKALKPVRNLPERKAFRLSPEATSQFLAL